MKQSEDKSTKPIILIQGPERSNEERVKEMFKGIIVQGEGTLTVNGIDHSFNAAMKLFTNKNLGKLFVTGNANDPLTLEDIGKSLYEVKQYIDGSDNKEVPIIIVNIHGTAATTKEPSITPHALALSHKPQIAICTSALFKLIHDHLQSPVELLLFSCQSGPAIKYVHLLPKNSKLITFTNDKSNISITTLEYGVEYLLEQDLCKDISALKMLQGYFLKSYDMEACKKITISISGSQSNSFMEFFEKNVGYKIPINELQKIYQEYEQFGFKSKITKMLESNVSDSELYKQLTIFHENRELFKEMCKPWGTKYQESDFEKIVNEMKGFNSLDEAVYMMTDKTSFNPTEEMNYWQGNKYGIDARTPVAEGLAILLFMYAQQEGTKVKLESLKEFVQEVIFFNNLPETSQYRLENKNIYYDILKETTNLEGFDSLVEITGGTNDLSGDF